MIDHKSILLVELASILYTHSFSGIPGSVIRQGSRIFEPVPAVGFYEPGRLPLPSSR
jgi:hypothetical protein